MSEMAIEYQRRPITVDDYERMFETGIIGPEERVELVDGEIVLMPPMGPPHRSSVVRLNELFVERLAGRASIFPQGPVRLRPLSEPEPDFQILLRREDAYLGEEPAPSNLYAVIECSDTSLRFDRGKKLRVYARAGIREYWIVNLVERCVEVYREPNDLGYAVHDVHRRGEELAFAGLPDIRLRADDLLGPAPV